MNQELIVVLDDLGNDAHQILKSSPYDVSFDACDLPKATAILVRSTHISKDIIDTIPNLKVIGRAGVGMDSIDVAYALSKKIKLCNSESGNSVNTAETTIGLILSLAHKITYAHTLLYEKHIWERGVSTEGFELDGKILGIIGFGNVGSKVAQLGHAFNMHIQIYDPYVKTQDRYIKQVDSLDQLLLNSDVISLHIPLTAETFCMITKEKLNLIKPSAYLVNTSRGKVIHEQDLIDTLKNKKIAGAALDVFHEEPLPFNSPLLLLNNVILTPHIAGAGLECRKRVSLLAVQKVISTLQEQ